MIFEPTAIGNLALANRLVMAPMTRAFSPGGIPNQGNIDYYRRRAQGGIGLIITEGTWIDHPVAGWGRDVPVFHGREPLAGWRRVAQAVHEAGGKIFPQLWHMGMSRNLTAVQKSGRASISPSGNMENGVVQAIAMTQRDIDDVVDAFARAALQARQTGFDGVELHGGHGYLIDQFFWDRTNQRTDGYGGTLAHRTRFACEIVAAIKQRAGADFPVSLRVSQWKQQDYAAVLARTAGEWEQFLDPLVAAGVDIFHVSTRRYNDAAFQGSPETLSALTRKMTGKTVIAVGSVGLTKIKAPGWEQDPGTSVEAERSVDEIEARLARGDFDLIALGRVLLANPSWGEIVRQGRAQELMPYTLAARDHLY